MLLSSATFLLPFAFFMVSYFNVFFILLCSSYLTPLTPSPFLISSMFTLPCCYFYFIRFAQTLHYYFIAFIFSLKILPVLSERRLHKILDESWEEHILVQNSFFTYSPPPTTWKCQRRRERFLWENKLKNPHACKKVFYILYLSSCQYALCCINRKEWSIRMTKSNV